jgi:hypothetical protein
MFRLKFLTVAIVAAVATLMAPATSQAAFKVNVYIDGGLVDTVNGTQDPITGLWSASKTQSYGTSLNFVTVQFTAESNVPGSATEGYVLNTTTNLTSGGTSATQHRIVLEAIGTPFSSPGVSGEQLYLSNRLTSVGGTGITSGPNSSNLDVYAQVDPDANTGTNNNVRTTAGSYSPKVVNGFTVYDTNTVAFTRGTNYSLTSVVDLTLAAGKSGQITTNATVVAPAPAGLIMALTAVPFLGVIRRRLRQTAAPTTAA